MPPTNLLDQYLTQLDFLDQIQQWRSKFHGRAEMKAFTQVIDDFQEFATDYFSHFLRDKTDMGDVDIQQMKLVLRRLRLEWNLLYRVGQQWALDSESLKTALDLTQEQALAYYARYQGYRRVKVDPVVYLEKVFKITRSLYTDYPIIAVPFENVRGAEVVNLQAVAHELGHFFYWNAPYPEKIEETHRNIRDALTKKLAITEHYDLFLERANVIHVWVSWVEETIADICGTLLGGEAFVQSAYDRMLWQAFTDRELTYDDGRHPAAIIRYQIGLETLRHLDPVKASGLDIKLGNQTLGIAPDDLMLSDNTVSIADLRTVLKIVVDILLNEKFWSISNNDNENTKRSFRELFLAPDVEMPAKPIPVQTALPKPDIVDKVKLLSNFRETLKSKNPTEEEDAFGRIYKRLAKSLGAANLDAINKALLESELSEEDEADSTVPACYKYVKQRC